MTPFTLSSTTIAAINTALAGGANGTPGTHNINFVTAYQDIYNDVAAQNAAGNTVNSGTLNWFQQAPLVDEQQWVPSAQGDFIWAYTTAAAASEGATITTTDLQNASNAIALAVFTQLKNASYVFTDANITNGFGTKEIIADDAGAGLNVIKAAYPDANLDDAIWGGTLFARSELGDSTYFTDYGLTIAPDTRDANAILAGLFAGSAATVAGGYTVTSTGLENVFNGNMDLAAVNSALSGEVATVTSWAFAASGSPLTGLGALAAGVNYIWNATTGGLVTLHTSDTGAPGVAYAYEPANDGLLTFNEGDAGSGTLTLSDGTALSVGSTADLSLSNSNIAGGSDTDEQALLGYLSDSGDPLTAAELDTDNFNYQNPTGTAYTVTGSPDGHGNDDFILGEEDQPPGAVVTGVSGYTNILESEGNDLTQDTISNIQVLDGGASLTGSQFDAFNTIEGGNGTIIIDSAGTYSLNSSGISGVGELMAGDWGGTTLIGSSTAHQVLAASLYGNDTLTAGNGSDDNLVAGDGVDTLIGGTGSDNFYIKAGVAEGTTVTGSGSGNTIVASAPDISGISITGVTTLDDDIASLTLTASQFSEFTTLVNSLGGTETLIVLGDGTYSLSGKTVTGSFTVATSSNVITGTSTNGQSLYANNFGDDVVVAGNGTGDNLYAGEGTDTLIAGSGGDSLYAGSGTDTLTGGSGGDYMQAGTGLDTLTGGSSSNWFATYNNLVSGDVLTAAAAIIVFYRRSERTSMLRMRRSAIFRRWMMMAALI